VRTSHGLALIGSIFLVILEYPEARKLKKSSMSALFSSFCTVLGRTSTEDAGDVNVLLSYCITFCHRYSPRAIASLFLPVNGIVLDGKGPCQMCM
jgi:hypothetical protein